MNGILVVRKPPGYTSFDCVAVVRRVSGEHKLGHTGTLDPQATGVLPICLGRATRLIEYMTAAPKRYRCVCRLGIETDTQDLTGSPIGGLRLAYGDKDWERPSEIALRDVFSRFIGELDQLPPMYSAVKVNGKKLYEYARKGREVDLEPRRIRVYSLEMLSYDSEKGECTLEICCGKGTYIRTICHDAGKLLGTGAAMVSLIRTSAAGFNLDQAIDIEDIKQMNAEELESHLLPFEAGVASLPRIEMDEKHRDLFFMGKPEFTKELDLTGLDAEVGSPVALFTDDRFDGIAIVKKGAEGIYLKAKKVFN